MKDKDLRNALERSGIIQIVGSFSPSAILMGHRVEKQEKQERDIARIKKLLEGLCDYFDIEPEEPTDTVRFVKKTKKED